MKPAMKTTWYKVAKNDILIEAVTVEKESEHCVWVENTYSKAFDRCFKNTEWSIYFPSWEAAHQHLLERLEKRVVYLQMESSATSRDYEKVKLYKAPK